MAEIMNVLPFGVKENGKTLKNFALRKLTAGEFKAINRKNYRENSPFAWLASTISYLVDEIDGIPVFSAFKVENFKKVPSVVKNMTMYDAFYVLYSGHYYNFDDKIKNFAFKCPTCGKLNNNIEVPLNSINFSEPNITLVEDGKFRIDLEKGFTFDFKEEQTNITALKLSLPTVSTLLDCDEYSDDDIQFMEEILKRSLYAIESDGIDLDNNKFFLLKKKVFDLILPSDMVSMNQKLTDISLALIADVNIPCEHCSSKGKRNIDLSFLLRM